MATNKWLLGKFVRFKTLSFLPFKRVSFAVISHFLEYWIVLSIWYDIIRHKILSQNVKIVIMSLKVLVDVVTYLAVDFLPPGKQLSKKYSVRSNTRYIEYWCEKLVSSSNTRDIVLTQIKHSIYIYNTKACMVFIV